MIRIDGSTGEGGGQILRSALALSAVTGQAFRMEKIRANRSRPGLMRQHLTSLRAARDISDASVIGDAVGASEISFEPGEIRAGDYHFPIGTAGGTGLVFQTVFTPLLFADAPSTVKIEGGTHNPASPPFDYLKETFLPAISGLGIAAEYALDRCGFYPAGGGCVRATINPSDLETPLDLTERGALKSVRAQAVLANLPARIAERELHVLKKELSGIPFDGETADWDSDGPGNALFVRVAWERHAEVYTSFGEHGVRAETVAARVAGRVRAHLKSEAVVGPYLADQLLVPMALGAGGRFTTLEPTPHFTTNVETIGKFLDVPIRVEQAGETLWTVEVG